MCDEVEIVVARQAADFLSEPVGPFVGFVDRILFKLGHDEAVVRRVTRLVDIAEYKRRQCPPGVRVTTKAFGRDRRMPITNGYRA